MFSASLPLLRAPQSNDGEERLAVVRLLAKLFGAKDSELASQNRPLWQCFLGRSVTRVDCWFHSVNKSRAGLLTRLVRLLRFNDIHVPVRLECVKFASHCLMNHPDLARDLTGEVIYIVFRPFLPNCIFSPFDLHQNLHLVRSEYLKVRSHDPEEAIRHDVIVTIINAGKKDLNLVNDQLLGFVRDRTLDKRVRRARDRTVLQESLDCPFLKNFPEFILLLIFLVASA